MRKNKKVFLYLLVILFSLVSSGIFLFKSYEDSNIEFVLKSESYSYLSENAANYIRSVYEETGEILLTEKNKI